jgi:serine protease Do
MKRKSIAAAVAAIGIVTAGAAVLNHQYDRGYFDAHAAPAAGVPVVRAPVALPDFAAIAQMYGPAVVNISTSGTRKAVTYSRGRGEEGDDPFGQFFRGLPFGFPQGDVPTRGQGSGFIVDAGGIVLTNAHVVRDASEVTVKLTDRREFRAKVLGADPTTDIAVLRIEAKDLPVVRLGNPDAARVGDWVVAIGSPFGFENSVSAGIVSAKGRSLPSDSSVPFLQTDVAVNPGNSGGPLFNLAGEVIGINSQIYSRSGGYQGVSFAIPINVALKVKDQIVATGRASHAQLGVTVQDVNQALAESFGLKSAQGAVVSSVASGSAAERAGVQPGDVVLQFNGKPVGAAGELSALVGQAIPGDKARVTVWRKGAQRELSATLGARNDTERAAAEPASTGGKLGLSVRPLTAEERREAKVSSGVLVEEASGAAAQAGVRPGDIVLMADGKPVKGVEDLRQAADSRKTVALLVQRGEARVFVPLRTS